MYSRKLLIMLTILGLVVTPVIAVIFAFLFQENHIGLVFTAVFIVPWLTTLLGLSENIHNTKGFKKVKFIIGD